MRFIGFFQSDDPEFEPADDMDERLDLAAAAIPRAIAANKGTVSGRVGRNVLCPCGSGTKYKRCCC